MDLLFIFISIAAVVEDSEMMRRGERDGRRGGMGGFLLGTIKVYRL